MNITDFGVFVDLGEWKAHHVSKFLGTRKSPGDVAWGK
jgi:hypothetical protein